MSKFILVFDCSNCNYLFEKIRSNEVSIKHFWLQRQKKHNLSLEQNCIFIPVCVKGKCLTLNTVFQIKWPNLYTLTTLYVNHLFFHLFRHLEYCLMEPESPHQATEIRFSVSIGSEFSFIHKVLWTRLGFVRINAPQPPPPGLVYFHTRCWSLHTSCNSNSWRAVL